MRINVVGQATGQHGWSSLEAYIHGAQALGHEVRVVQPRAPWGAPAVDDDDGLFDLLAQRRDEPLLLCGFDWHSQPMHRDARLRDALRAWPGPRIGLLQEHLDAGWIRQDTALAQLFDEAALSAADLLTHLACNHEGDVALLRRLGVRLPVTFLPFCADLSVFRRERALAQRDPRAFFRGKRMEFMGSSPYVDRERIAAWLRHAPEALIEDLQPSDQLDRRAMIERYVADLNRHALQLNLPSVSDSLTCRPFEVMACGGLLLQAPPQGELSERVLPPSLYLPFDRQDPQSVLAAIRAAQADPEGVAAMVDAAHRHVSRHHDAATRVRQLVGWATGQLSEAELARELSACDGAPARRVQIAGADLPKTNGTDPNGARIVVDLVFYQYARSGIAQVWNRLLRDWIALGHADRFVLLQRAGARHAPPPELLAAYRVQTVPAHGGPDDAALLQRACDAQGATLFISTYYSVPQRTPALLLMHDCIPERMNPDCGADPEWAEKRAAIAYADAYLCISRTTADDLLRFYPQASADKLVYVSHNAFPTHFAPPTDEAVVQFRHRHGLRGPYLLFAGERFGYRAYKNVEAVCRALGALARRHPELPARWPILFLGGGEWGDRWTVEPELERHLAAWEIHRLSVADAEMPAAYAGAALTLYPSLIEGFGLPPGESLLCGTPVLAWRSPINEEVYGDLVETLDPAAPGGLERQLQDVLARLPALRERTRGAPAAIRARAAARGASTQSGTFLECLLLHAQRPLDWSNAAREPLLFDAPPEERADWLQRLIAGHPDEITGRGLRFGQETLRAAAIVSIYNGPDFMQGCLDDLCGQTERAAGRMEVLLIDSASPGGEAAFVRPQVRATRGLRYLRTVERESLYRAWNRGARGARSRYLSNANLDDRHRCDFFERLADTLDAEPAVQLVYPAQYLSAIPNEPFAEHRPVRSWGWPDYSLEQLRIGNHVGSQPMWRRALHQQIGDFEERYRIAGDYDYWCRIAHHVGPLKLYPAHVGLYYFNGTGIEHGDPLRSEREVAEICARYGIRKNYVTSEADQERASADGAGGATAPREIEDLQYSGIVLNGQVNVIIDLDGELHHDVEAALRLADAALGQSVGVSHRIQVLLRAASWSEAGLRALNENRLQPLTTQIRAARSLQGAPGFDPQACTVLLSATPTDRRAFEAAMQALYAEGGGRSGPLSCGGRSIGRVARSPADLETQKSQEVAA